VGWLALLNNLEHPDECRILDISSDGIRLLTDEDLPVDEAICLGFHEHILVVRVRNVVQRGNQFAIGAERIFSFPKEDFGEGPPTFEKLQALLADKGWAIEVNTEIEDAEPEPVAREAAPVYNNVPEPLAARRVPVIPPAPPAPERRPAIPALQSREPQSREPQARELENREPQSSVLLQDPPPPPTRFPEPLARFQEPPAPFPEPPPPQFPEPVDRRSGPLDWGPMPTMPEAPTPRKSLRAPVALAATIVLLIGAGALYVNFLRNRHPAPHAAVASVTPRPEPVESKPAPAPDDDRTASRSAVASGATPTPAAVTPPAAAPAKTLPAPAKQATPVAVTPPPAAPAKALPAPAKQATPVATAPPVAARPTPAPAAAAAPKPASSGTHHVKVSIIEPAWLTASADGKALLGLGKMYGKNESFEFDFSGVSFVHLGNSRGVTVTVDGKPINLPEPHAVVGVLQLTPSGSHLLPWTPKDPVAEPRS
jgi:homeobox protein ESX1